MDIHHSPIKIVSKVNIPDVCTPDIYSSKNSNNTHLRKSTLDVLQTKRTQILLLKDAMQYPLAFQKVNELIRNYPRDVRLLQLKAEITFLMKEYTIALQIYQQLLDSSNSSQNLVISNPLLAKHRDMSLQQQKKLKALYLYNKALCLQKLNKNSQAIQALKESIQINKNRLQSYMLLADLYRQSKNLAKVYKIYRKILQKNRKSEYLFKAIRICQEEKEYQEMLNLIQIGMKWDTHGTEFQMEEYQKQLLRFKGEALKKLNKFQDAIQVYHRIIEGELNEAKLVKIYSKIAICYDFTGNLSKACEYYKKILLINQNSMDTINNLANLQIRRKHNLQAINILNTGILKLLAQNNSQHNLTLSLLRSHRVIAFAKLNLIAQAKQDLQEIMNSMKDSKQWDFNQQKDAEKYKFVRYIVEKYQVCSDKIKRIKIESNNQLEEVMGIEKELVCSISQSLHKPYSQDLAKNNLDQLSTRIDNLYNEIIAFKKATFVQHQTNADKVHNKIAQIEQILNKKQQDSAKLQKQLQQLKQQNQNIYNFVLELKQSDNHEYTRIINDLKKQNKHLIANYIQGMYWTFNIYFVCIRLVANGLMHNTKNIHLNKASAFFAKFKKVFQSVSKLPHMSIVCEIITSIISLYLSEQNHLVYKGLNQIITKKYSTEKALEMALELALVNLAKSNYVQEIFKRQKPSANYDNNLYHKACEWFRSKKNKLIQKMFKIQNTSTPQQKFIQETVIEDVSATFVYLIKNKSSLLNTPSQERDVLFQAFDKTLVQGFKNNEIRALYSKQTGNSAKKEQQGEACSKCVLY